MATIKLKEALHLAIKARKRGRFREADKYYTAILKSRPNQPEANHNMGLLAISLEKLERAVPFFQKAVEEDPNVAEYWLDYISVFIELGHYEKAKVVLLQAKSICPDEEAFIDLEEKLKERSRKKRKVRKLDLDKITQLIEIGSLDKSIELATEFINLCEEDSRLHSSIAHAYILNNDLERARGHLTQAKRLNPDSRAVGCNYARLFLRQGQLDEALTLVTRLLEEFPDDPEGMVIMGACLRGKNQIKESLEILNRALMIKPDYAEALLNRGMISLALGNKEAAGLDLEKAYKLKPFISQVWPSLGLIFMQQEKFKEAEEIYEKLIKAESDQEGYYFNLAKCKERLNDRDAAIANYEHAIKLKSDFAIAYNSLGILYADSENFEKSIDCYIKAIETKPDFDDAFWNITVVLSRVDFVKPRRDLHEILQKLILSGRYRAMTLAPIVMRLLKVEPEIKSLFAINKFQSEQQEAEHLIKTLSKFPSLLTLMRICPIPNLEFEDLFAKLRKYLLANRDEKWRFSEKLPFLECLALNCLSNHYVFFESEKEREILAELQDKIRDGLISDNQPRIEDILIFACYREIHLCDWSNKLLLGVEYTELLQRLIVEPQQEKKIAEKIPVLLDLSDQVSIKVRNQYEINPYPTWITSSKVPSGSIRENVSRMNLRLSSEKVCNIQAPEILIAGCGTGQQAVEAAIRYKDCQIIAVDLSLSSLAYAARKTEERRIENIKYMQADILNLESLKLKFDMIYCTGVLHHMNEPVAGWKILTKMLRPNGLMKIGLYSKLARKPINLLREEISTKQIAATSQDIRSFRRSIATSNDEISDTVKKLDDFYSLHEVRDLLFHVQEHQFTIPQINECLMQMDLDFCGFDNAILVNAFSQNYQDSNARYDLEKWHEFETENPRIFLGMYQFWCQKKQNSELA